MSENTDYVKILFPLVQEDGWPPSEAETMWAVSLGAGKYRIDNIPFHAMGISDEDIVIVEEKDGVLHYEATVEKSEFSTVRVIAFDQYKREEIRSKLIQFGCSVERMGYLNLISASIPKHAWRSVCLYLDAIADDENIAWEHGSIRE